MHGGRDHAVTVASIKSAVDFPTLGGEIRKVKKTREKDALIEFWKNPGVRAAANHLHEAIRSKPELGVGLVAYLGLMTEAEIKDIDSTESKKEVLEAVKRAIRLSQQTENWR